MEKLTYCEFCALSEMPEDAAKARSEYESSTVISDKEVYVYEVFSTEIQALLCRVFMIHTANIGNYIHFERGISYLQFASQQGVTVTAFEKKIKRETWAGVIVKANKQPFSNSRNRCSATAAGRQGKRGGTGWMRARLEGLLRL